MFGVLWYMLKPTSEGKKKKKITCFLKIFFYNRFCVSLIILYSFHIVESNLCYIEIFQPVELIHF